MFVFNFHSDGREFGIFFTIAMGTEGAAIGPKSNAGATSASSKDDVDKKLASLL